ncbi:MAG: glycine oxidase ThiO [Thermoleophilaceae bacterium]
MQAPEGRSYDAVVVGAGLIGLACGWRAAEQGLSVLVAERAPKPGAGASGVAAGMLAPVTEADFGEERLLRLNLDARERWPAFAARLEERTGLSIGYRETGALFVAADRDDVAELRRLHDFQRALGLDAEWLAPRDCRALEPGLSPRVSGGVLCPNEAQADPPAVLAALSAAVRQASGELACGVEVQGVELDGGRVAGVRTATGVVRAPRVVIAAGAWSAGLAPGGRGPAVRPVKGQIIQLRVRGGGPEPLTRIVRSPRCYLLARGDGRVVLGATVEEQGFDTAVTVDGVHRLLEAAREVLPEVAELELVAARAGLRPGSRDNVPVVSADPRTPGLTWATGHYRNGVLLAPHTAELVATLLTGERVEARA